MQTPHEHPHECAVTAETAWHFWSRPGDNYAPEDADGYEPRAGLGYQEDECNLDFYSRLQDVDVDGLMASLASGARMAAWRLHHFTDEHTAELQAILHGWLLEEPCCFTAQLALVAYRHWLYFGNPAIAETVLMHMLRSGYCRDDIVEELTGEDDLMGEEENIDPEFIVFVEEVCATSPSAC